MPIFYVWFSFAGRINRKTYWLKGVLILALFSIAFQFAVGMAQYLMSLILGDAEMASLIVTIIVILPYMVFSVWTSLAISFKRVHDRNRSAWFLLIAIIPLIGPLWLLIDLGFLRGTEGDNRYGPDPLMNPEAYDGPAGYRTPSS